MRKFDPLKELLTPLVARGLPKTRGVIRGLPVSRPVEVLRDRWGIPHIYASDALDLFAAQGFVHAQDRLWQMEAVRRIAQGSLSEIAGPRLTDLDFLCRLLGFPSLRGRAYAGTTDQGREMLAAYARGVNAQIESRGRRLPLEFSSMGFAPEPWVSEDSLSFLVMVSWQMLFAHYNEKLCALERGATIREAEWNDIFPSTPGAVLPREPWFDSLSGLKLGALDPSVRAFDKLSAPGVPAQGSGSNNWAVAAGADGKPLLANDPHLGIVLPATWYFCHLDCPPSPGFPSGIHVAGASVAGCPGVAIGRNEHVAWGFTNVTLDAVDILVMRVDPRDPMRYRVEGRELGMATEEITVRPRGSTPVSRALRRTERGPVITALTPGVEAAAVLRWYGTIPEDMLLDHTIRGLLSFMTARTAEDVMTAGEDWKWVAWNIVTADDGGHIGWHACGAAPVRRGYTGRLPADGSAGADWTGFLPYHSMPHRLDPPEGFLATANQKITPEGAAQPLSWVWHGQFRHPRISGALSRMASPGVGDFARLQMDVHSMQADALVPKITALSVEGALAREAQGILADWDREVRADSAGAALFEIFLDELDRVLLARLFGDDHSAYAAARSGYGLRDVILDRPGSPLWAGTGGPGPTVGFCLTRAMGELERLLGKRRASWAWGRLHRYVFRHPGADGPLLSRLLNPAPLPAPGDCNTVNVSWFGTVPGTHTVTVIPSMRMIVPLGDLEGMRVSGPLGQSGQPGHRHYDDMLPLWASGGYVRLPMGRPAVEETVRERLALMP